MISHRTAARPAPIGLALALTLTTLATTARADTFSSYSLQSSFTLPGSDPAFDALPDGRVVVVGMSATTPTLYLETTAGSHTFAAVGVLPGADFSSFGAAFVRVSPSGAQIAVGNDGGSQFDNFQVGVFSLSGLTGKWFTANHFDGRWIDNRYVALTAAGPSGTAIVTALDTTSASAASPSNVTLVDSIGGASGGIAFDASGNLFTADGFVGAGPSQTGEVHAILSAAWHAALSGGPAVHFETQGIPIVRMLSASPIAFDTAGDLVVGGANSFGSPVDDNYFGIVHAPAVAAALAGGGLVNSADPTKVRKLDPDSAASSSYAVGVNAARGDLYAVPFGSSTAYDFTAPVVANAPALPGAGVGALAVAIALGGAIPRRRRRLAA